MLISDSVKNIGLLVENSAVRYAGKKALHFDHDDTFYSYSDLNTMVNRYACFPTARNFR